MVNTLNLEVGGLGFKVSLLENDAPETCKAFVNALPIIGHVIHARWSGEAVWFPMDSLGIKVPAENQTSYPSRGDLLYYPGGISEKELLIPYGSSLFASKVGQLQGNHFASVTNGVERLSLMGRKVLWEGAQPLVLKHV